MKTFAHIIRQFAVLGAFCLSAHAQSLTFSTLAGYPGKGYADGSGTNALFYTPQGIAADTNGNLYIADSGNNTIRKITPAGNVSTLAGSAGITGHVDGTGTNALFNQPGGIAVDGGGNVYVADSGNSVIRKITPAGVVTTVAGSSMATGSNNASGTNATFLQPLGIAVDTATNLYVADYGNHIIRKITPLGAVSTLAGTAGVFGGNDGSGASAEFYEPEGVAVDLAGNVYVADTANGAVREITPLGVVTTLAGTAGKFGATDATGTNALFYQPEGIAVDSATNLYVADYFKNTIRKITPTKVVTTLCGSAGNFGSADGVGSAATFLNPQGITVNSSGVLFVADSGNGTVRMITSGTVATFAGTPSAGSFNGTGPNARFSAPAGIAADSSGNSYVADAQNSVIRKITTGGVASVFAGSPGTFGSADGPGSSALFSGPLGIAVDGSGNVYVSDTGNSTIRKITSGGTVSTFAGTAGLSGNSDGTGSAARFYQPEGIAVDSGGNLYVADTLNYTLRKITSGGVVTTLAGLANTMGSFDGTNSNARFNWPVGVAVDGSGNIYVSDFLNDTIREVTPAGVVSTLAGTAGLWGSADGNNSNARFNGPAGLTRDSSGNLYVADSGNNVVRKLSLSGTNWVVTTPGGSSILGGSTDGTGTNALFNYPAGAAVSSASYTFVADSANNTIRVVGTIAPSILGQPQNQTNIAGTTVLFGATAFGTSLTYHWVRGNSTLSDGGNISGSQTTTLTLTNIGSGDASSYSLVANNSAGSATSAVATLTVLLPPTITNQPASQTNIQGATVTFSVAASGATPFSYQWSKGAGALTDGGNILGSQSAILTVSGIGASDSASYSVVVTNIAGSATSMVATLTVIIPPAITNQPSSITTDQGTTVLFGVGASGTSPFAYRWSKSGGALSDGGEISGSSSSILTLSGVTLPDAGSYNVVLTNGGGSATSAVAILIVNHSPVAVNDSFNVTENQTLTVVAASGVLANDTNYSANSLTAILGATTTNGSLTLHGDGSFVYIPNTNFAGADSFTYTASDGLGNSSAATASITISAIPPSIGTQPTNLAVECGSNATLTVAASGTTLNYQWYLSATNAIPNATNASLIFTNASLTNSGSYDVLITNSAGSVTSQVAVLTVGDTMAPVVTLNGSASTELTQGGSFTDPGATANDTCAGSVAVASSGSVNTSVVGAYILSYVATDPSGNSATNTRLVSVLPISSEGLFQSITLLSDGSVELSMIGTPGDGYQLQDSPDFTNWSVLTTITNTNGYFLFNDPSSITNLGSGSNPGARYYRLLHQSP